MYQQCCEPASHGPRSSTATDYVPAGCPDCLTRVIRSTATGYVPEATQLPSHGSLKHSNRLYQQSYRNCPHTGRSSTATGYVPAGYTRAASHGSLKHSNRLCTSNLELPHTGRSSTATGYVPAGWSCLTQVSSTATGYVPAGYLGASNRSLKQQQAMYQQATSCLHTGRSSWQQAMYQQATWAASQVSSTATGYVPAGYAGHLTQVAQAQQQAMYHEATLVPHTGRSSTATIMYTRLP
jgi:hypothetical protein